MQTFYRVFAQGGGLVASGAISLYDEWGKQRSNFALADLFGVDYISHSPYSFAYIRAVDDDNVLGLDGAPLPHYRPLLQVKPNKTVQVAAVLVEPLIETTGELYYHNNKPAPYRATDVPAIVLTRFGAGRVVYFSGEPGLNYAVLGDPHYRHLIHRAMQWAANGPFENRTARAAKHRSCLSKAWRSNHCPLYYGLVSERRNLPIPPYRRHYPRNLHHQQYPRRYSFSGSFRENGS